MNKKYIVITAVTAFLAVSPGVVFADEIVISGNGSESTQSVSTTQSSQTTVQQSNTADVSNNIDTQASTGENSASGNTGDATIQTGDVSSDTTVTNQLNNSQVDAGCCDSGESSASITGNGSDTTNTISVNTSTKNTAVVNQYANISNNISGKAVTGNNSANDNNGNVVVKTGDIHVDANIKNSPVNISKIKLANGKSDYSLSISGNGHGSRNDITFNDSYENTIFENNHADIVNNVLFDLITGGNKANDNTGDVFISTGDIKVHIDVVNGPINVNDVTISCCDDDKEEPVSPPPTPTQPPGKGGSSSGGNGGSGSSQGHSDSLGGSILPVTGPGSFMFIAFLVSSIMLFLGSVLRLRSGRSPGLSI